MPALRMWLHPAVWVCIPLNVGQEAAVRSQRSPPALPATGRGDGGGAADGSAPGEGWTTGQRDAVGRAPSHAPTTARCTYFLPGQRKGWLWRTPLVSTPFSFVAAVSFTTIPQPSPTPRKTHKTPQPENHFPTNSTA